MSGAMTRIGVRDGRAWAAAHPGEVPTMRPVVEGWTAACAPQPGSHTWESITAAGAARDADSLEAYREGFVAGVTAARAEAAGGAS